MDRLIEMVSDSEIEMDLIEAFENEDLFKVSLMSCTVENLTFTVSLGFSSVYNLLLEPLGFLPVPFLGSASNKIFSINLSNCI